MKIFVKPTILTSIITLFAVSSFAAAVNITESNISATIAAAPSLYFSQNTGLGFGGFYADKKNAGVVTININGALSATNAIIVVPGSGSVGVFDVVGSPNTTYSVSSVPSVTLDSPNGKSMTANVTVSDDSLVGGSTYKLNSLGKDTFKTVGSINVGKKQKDGVYSGLYPITIFP